MNTSATLKNYIELHFIVFIWGFTGVLGALISLSALDLVYWRVAISFAILLIFLGFSKNGIKWPPKNAWPLLTLQGAIIALHWFTFYAAIKASNVSVTLSCFSSAAFFAAIIEPIIYKRKLVLYELLLGVVAIIAIAIIFEANMHYWLGIVFALIAALTSALFAVINGKLVQKHEAIVITQVEMMTALVFLMLALLVTNPSALFNFPPVTDWFYLLILAAVCTVYPFIRSIALTKYLNPFTVVLSINMEPVYGIILAFMVLGENKQVNTGFYIGTALIFLSIIANAVLKQIGRKKAALLN